MFINQINTAMPNTSTAVAPRIYVGTYAKYNGGSIFGKWIDLSDFSCKDDFISTCVELHKDESDPELMFQDWEGIPGAFISECSIDEDFWEWWEDFEDLCSAEQDAYMDYAENQPKGVSVPLSQFRDDYQGCFDSERDFAEHLADEQGFLDTMEKAGISPAYFDAEAYANDLFCGDFWMSDNGNVFRR